MKPTSKINRRRKNDMKKYERASSLPLPYNTGKVLIGSRYVQPSHTPTAEEETIQLAMLGIPTEMTTHKRNALRYVAGVAVLACVIYLLSKGV
jgi:hypothetical protein